MTLDDERALWWDNTTEDSTVRLQSASARKVGLKCEADGVVYADKGIPYIHN